MAPPHIDFIPLRALDVCSEKGCVFPAKWLVFDMWGGVPMCAGHRDQILRGESLEDRSTPFDTRYGSKSTGEKSSLDGAQVIRKDWFECPALPYDRIPEYLWDEIRRLALVGVGNRAISRLIGYHRNAVRRVILLKFPEVTDAPCKCGLSRRHQGWCKVRFANSMLRQSVMRLMHIKRFATVAKAKGFSPDEIRDAVARCFPGNELSAQKAVEDPTPQAPVTRESHNYKKREGYKRGTYTRRADKLTNYNRSVPVARSSPAL
jgi:hypothetical protein